MTDVFRLLQAASRGLPVLEAVQRASRGDEEAIRYLKDQGWCDALDALIRPGVGAVARQAVQMVKGYADGSVIDGEYREINGPPWGGFIKRLLNTDSGGHILTGSMGTGKTTLAIKLAWQWHNRLGYKVEVLGMYPEDVPDFARVISIDTLIKRMERLEAHLHSLEEPEEDDEEPNEPARKGPVSPPPPNKVIIIDEAGMNIRNTGTDPGRRAALQALAQSRHASWLVLYLAQWTGQLPLPLLGQSCVWVKKPRGDERDTDRDNPLVRKIWEDAEEGFKGLRSSPWYGPPYQDTRSWAFVRCLSLNGKPGYQGMIPFTPYRPGQAAEVMDSGEQESNP